MYIGVTIIALIKEAIDSSLQAQSKAVNDRTLLRSLIHVAMMAQKQFDGITQTGRLVFTRSYIYSIS